jgi:hypothetical protein
MERHQLGTELDPERRIKVGERLIEEKDLGLPNERAAQRHSLPLAARELARHPVQQLVKFQPARGVLDQGRTALPRNPSHLERELQVLPDGEVGVQCVTLKYHGDVAPRGRQVVDPLVADQKIARRGRLEPGESAEDGALAASGGAEDGDEFAIGDSEVYFIEYANRWAKDFGDFP